MSEAVAGGTRRLQGRRPNSGGGLPIPAFPPAKAPILWLRHASHFAPLLLLAGAGAGLALPPSPGDIGPLQGLYAFVVALNIVPLAMASWGGILGAAVTAWQRLGGPVAGPVLRPPTGRARTAILLPIFEEDPIRVFAAVDVMAEAVARERAGTFAFFVLSDTSSSEAALAEERAFASVLTLDRPGRPAVHYRRRADRAGRKAGNIADFCARWGADYDYAVVLDADSLMSGEAIARLVGAMEANPGAALVQGMCYPVGRETLFARHQQFSAWLYGPLFQRGTAFWQGPRGSYWGHNAILRVAAFAAHCGLPSLPGPAPLGGEIMSHDTVEAALLLRAGWDAWMLPDSPDDPYIDSWEEVPTNVLDHLKRERRWCQGNLQHLAVLGAHGLRFASRYHLGTGILHYLSSLLVLLWLALHALVDRRAAASHDWALAALVLLLILAPRALCLGATLANGAAASRFGGRLPLLASAALDQAFSLLFYPVTLVFHAVFVGGALTGHVVRWDAQARTGRGIGTREAAGRLAGPLLAGLVALGLLAGSLPLAAALLAPGLLLGVPLAVWSSRHLGGRWAKALFTIPEETRPHPVRQALAAAEARLRATTPSGRLPSLPRDNGMPLVTQALRRA